MILSLNAQNYKKYLTYANYFTHFAQKCLFSPPLTHNYPPFYSNYDIFMRKIASKSQKIQKKVKKIWWDKKIVVILHPLLKQSMAH